MRVGPWGRRCLCAHYQRDGRSKGHPGAEPGSGPERPDTGTAAHPGRADQGGEVGWQAARGGLCRCAHTVSERWRQIAACHGLALAFCREPLACKICACRGVIPSSCLGCCSRPKRSGTPRSFLNRPALHAFHCTGSGLEPSKSDQSTFIFRCSALCCLLLACTTRTADRHPVHVRDGRPS